jgi:hypothetical protein
MAQATILAAGTTAATSTDVAVAAGANATVGIFVASGDIPHSVQLGIWADTPGGDVLIDTLNALKPAKVITGPGTFRVVRGVTEASVGVFSEA